MKVEERRVIELKKKSKPINPLNRNQRRYNKYEIEEYMMGDDWL